MSIAVAADGCIQQRESCHIGWLPRYSHVINMSNSNSKHTFHATLTRANTTREAFVTSGNCFRCLPATELTHHAWIWLAVTSRKLVPKFMHDNRSIRRCTFGSVLVSATPQSLCCWSHSVSTSDTLHSLLHGPLRWLVDETCEPESMEYVLVCTGAQHTANTSHGRYYLLSFRRIEFFWIMLYAGAGWGLDRSGSSPLCSRFMCCKHHAYNHSHGSHL